MIIEQFNLLHLLVLGLLPLSEFFGLYLFLRKKTQDTQRKILLIISLFNIALYVVYKLYQAFIYDNYDFELIYNLPLHFCNLNLIVFLPLALYTKNRTLMEYQVYIGTLLSFFALHSIDPAFRGQPFFEFSCLVYFYYHGMLLVIPWLFLVFGYFKPNYKTVWKSFVMLFFLTLAAHLLNLVLRLTGIAPEANYFFTYGIAGDPFTEFFYRIIPINFLFMIPYLFTAFVPYASIIILPYYIRDKRIKN